MQRYVDFWLDTQARGYQHDHVVAKVPWEQGRESATSINEGPSKAEINGILSAGGHQR